MIFSDHCGLLMYVGIAVPKVLADVARGLGLLFEICAGVIFLLDVNVLRSDYFVVNRSAE